MDTRTHRMLPPLSTAAEAVSWSRPASGTSRGLQERSWFFSRASSAGWNHTDGLGSCVVPADRRSAHAVACLLVRAGSLVSSKPVLGPRQRKPRITHAGVKGWGSLLSWPEMGRGNQSGAPPPLWGKWQKSAPGIFTVLINVLPQSPPSHFAIIKQKNERTGISLIPSECLIEKTGSSMSVEPHPLPLGL